MCGFVGFTGEAFGSEQRLRCITDMTREISHRGPDESGVYTDKCLTLGFARLKIIDLENGRQPMLSNCGRYVLCFNGEIYNYRELGRSLVNEFGVTFKTKSDTEVLMYALICYGDRALERLRGMFAFCFYDRERERFILARDPFGIKPLYYGSFGETFMFASEIKALLSHPKFEKEFNSDILPYYLQFQYVPTEETAFKGVKRLLPGHILSYSKGDIRCERYFYPTVYERRGYLPYGFFCERNCEERKFLPYLKNRRIAVKKISAAVKDSVKAHLVSDVPLGTFLSGGVDSGYITALAKPETAFTVGFPSYGFDERVVAAKTAEDNGVKLISLEADADDFFAAVGSVQYHSDEPYANLSAIPLYLLSQKAKSRVSTVLSGEGADELFGGYEWYFDSVIGKIYRILPEKFRQRLAKNGAGGRIAEFMRRNKGDARREYIGQAKITDPVGAAALLKKPYGNVKDPYIITAQLYSESKNASLLKSKKYLDTAMWLPCDILLKADRMTMASSLELRVPYLDLEVLRAAEGLSDRLLVRGKNGKCVFRKVDERVIGKENAYRKKKGFPVPFREWIRQKKYTEILENSFKGSVAESFFDTDRLNSLLVSHVNGKENNARVLYTVFAFIKWYEIYFSNGVKNPSLGADKLKNDTVPMISVTRKEKRNEKMDGDHTRI